MDDMDTYFLVGSALDAFEAKQKHDANGVKKSAASSKSFIIPASRQPKPSANWGPFWTAALMFGTILAIHYFFG